MNLRTYQENFVTNIAVALTKVRKVVGQLATGGGKTVVFAAIANRYINKSGKRVLILVHRKELLQQTRKTAYNAFGLVCEPIVAGMKFIPDADIYVGMIETTWRRLSKLHNIGLVIIDECHIASFNKVIEHFPEQMIIGFSATPLSSSKKRPVKMFYEDIVCGIDIPELIGQGFLCQNITWAPKDTVDRLSLHMKGNDFDEIEMAEKFSRPRYITNTVKAYERWSKGTKTIVFNVNVAHSKAVCDAFVEAGYNCKHVDGETPSKERDRILNWFATTPDAILCNVGIATTGFDEPTIETVVVNKATQAMPLWLQMCGRGGRVTESKSAFTIIDMGGNAVIHGDWCQKRDWVRIFNEPPKPGKPTAAPVKSCPKCDAIIPAGARVCQYCGYVFPEKSRDLEAELHEFVVVTKGIDVEGVIKANLNRKIYYSLFQIGRQLASQASNTIPQMSDEYANFILQKYFELGREWTKSLKKRFNKWHQDICEETLYKELAQLYPKWAKTSELVPKDAPAPAPEAPIENMRNIEPLKNLNSM